MAPRSNGWQQGAIPQAFAFPGSLSDRARGGKGTSWQKFAQGLDFSFAGLKTALLYRLRDLPASEIETRAGDLAASYQAAIVDSLLVHAERGLERPG